MKNIICIRHGRAYHNKLSEKIGDRAYFLKESFDAPLLEEGLNQFFDGSYLGTNEDNNIKEFNDLLPDEPDWIT